MLEDLLDESFVAAMGLDSMSHTERANILASMTETLMDRIISMAFFRVSRRRQRKIHKTAREDVLPLLRKYIPDFDLFVAEQISEFKAESLRLRAAADKILAENA